MNLGKALELQHKYEHQITATAIEDTSSSDYWKGKNLDHFKYRLSDIKAATQNFDERYCIGSGGSGKVYKTQLDQLDEITLPAIEKKNEHKLAKKCITVAIKRMGQGEKGFLTEIEILCKLRHPNVVSLLGFCDEESEMILVYEYMSNGSLDDCLGNIDKMTNLTWAKRIQICLDIAYGVHYLHTSTKGKGTVIHRDIRSAEILLDDNWVAKIADIGLSKFHRLNNQRGFIDTNEIVKTIYLDPDFMLTGRLNTKSDIYSFGVVMFEIFCGKLAYDRTYNEKRLPSIEKRLPSIARQCFKEGTMENLIDPKIKEAEKNNSILIGGVDQDSLNTFSKVAYHCLAETQPERPTSEVIIKELEKSLCLQRNNSFNAYPLEVILSATKNFSDENLITEGRVGNVYNGTIMVYGKMDICVWRLDYKYGQGDELETEISRLSSLKHKNVISAVGYCNEDGQKIIIYKHVRHRSFGSFLSDPTIMTWSRRLQICLGVSRALNYIHYDVIHCDINSSKILLDEDWEPKIFGFELSTKYPQSWKHRLLYFDKTNMTPKYDVYSFGVLLFEVLYGMKPNKTEHGVKVELEETNINPDLRKQMDTQSLVNFTKITYNCLNEDMMQRPTMDQIVKELEDVLDLQWKHENLEQSTPAGADEDTSSSLLKTEWLKIPLREIWEATNGFNQTCFVGSGGYGIVYKAELPVLDIQDLSSMKDKRKGELPKSKRTVAIKYITNGQDDEGKQGFLSEIDLLTSCKHPNVVALLGFSNEAHHMILVYEYAINGSLSDYLDHTSSKTINLTWEKRIQICLDIASGIKYLHTNMEGKPRIIHRDIKSDNILLDENLNAKVADFGLSKFHITSKKASSVYTKHIAGTEVYLDPEYLTSGKYKKESDIYSFGVVLFEILSGSLAYDSIYTRENVKGLAPIARRHFTEKTLKELIDPKMIKEDDEQIVTLNRGPNEESFETFSRIAYQCLAETQAKRPTIEVIIEELHRALNLQGETVVLSRFRLNDVLSATNHFSEVCCIGLDEYDMVYKAELNDFEDKSSLAFKEKNDKEWSKIRMNVAIKRISSGKEMKQRFFSEIEMRATCKHPNIVSFLGFCNEGDEMILVYEYPFNKSLDDYLKNSNNMSNLTWTQRLHMCLAIARGLDHLHTKIPNRQKIKHGDLRSANILLGNNLEPKIAYYGISKFHLGNQEESTLVRTKVYWDPEYEKTHIMKIESDIYSFGVILFEVFCGRLAYDPFYIVNNDKGLASTACSRINDGTIKELIDPKLKEANDDDVFTSSRGPNQDSLDTFLKIAYQCLGEAQAKRPTMGIVIEQLEMALNFQENQRKSLQFSLKDIELATENFNQKNWFGRGRYWEAYKGELPHASANTTIVAKRWNSNFDDQFRTEHDILLKRKHKNIIGLVGYCNEMNDKIIVYEHASKGSLDKYLNDSNLKWMKRLQISIDVASALEFLHGGDLTLKKVVHRDLKSHSILLNDDWDAKISNLELSSLDSSHQDMEHISDDAFLDPQYKQGFLTEKSDIYSFGVILFEVFCGRSACVEGCEDNIKSLGPLAKQYYEQGKLDEIVFGGIKEQIVLQSLTTFAEVAYQCLHKDGYKRPEAREVVIQLKKALEFQEDFEIWELKLPRDYKEILQLSETPEIYHTKKKKDIYMELSNGILLPKEKLWYILSNNGKANKMVSATLFSYENHDSHRWRSIQKSRYGRVAKILDVSNLKIQITINNKFLSPEVVYGVYLVFKFCDPRIFPCKRMYMNLKYTNRTKTLSSYFATWRDEEWMMIELYRFSNHKEDVTFGFLLDSFSRYYCRSGAIYIEGIEFLAIKNVAYDDIKNPKDVQQIQKSNSDLDHLHQPVTINEEILETSEKLILSKLNGKQHLMLFATEVLYNSKKLKTFRFKSLDNSRFQNVAELLRQQVFRIKYKIEIQMLSPFTEYTCYLVFKVSERCRGLHCPVKVRDLLYRKNNECKNIFLRTPAPWNQHDDFLVPAERKDGWMEVVIWKFNSKNNKLEKNLIPMNLKLITYEGTMLGLIIGGLEFRPT